jgi:hypothetical protein
MERPSRSDLLTTDLRAYFKKLKPSSQEVEWQQCLAYLFTTYPARAFRSAGTYYYKMATCKPGAQTKWDKSGAEYYGRMKGTIELYVKGELVSSMF